MSLACKSAMMCGAQREARDMSSLNGKKEANPAVAQKLAVDFSHVIGLRLKVHPCKSLSSFGSAKLQLSSTTLAESLRIVAGFAKKV